MAAAKAKAKPTYIARNRDGVYAAVAPKEPVKAVTRTPRPLQGKVDYDELITAAMKKFTKTRARLAE
jgi:hypothetical protein